MGRTSRREVLPREFHVPPDAGYKSEFLADFAENATWPSESRPAIFLRRRLSPSAIKFDHPKDNKAITLPPFTVVNKRFFG
jgi:hypothetical protein